MSTIHAQPAPPSQDLPSTVTEPMSQLLGYAIWTAGAILVASVITAAGLLWWVHFLGNPATTIARKLGWIAGCGIVLGVAAPLANFVLQ